MVSMIIVDYKSMDKTIKYIKECASNIQGLDHFVIVDNASDVPIKPRKMVVEKKEVYLVSSGENGGYAKGNNLGAKTAKEIFNDDYYIFSNNDLKFNKQFLLQVFLDPFGEDNRIAAVGPKMIGLDGWKQNPLVELTWKQSLFSNFTKLLLPKHIKKQPKEASKGPCRAVSGAFMCVDSKKFWECGGFDENTFLFMEEMILSSRYSKKEYYMYFNNDVEVIHEHGDTVKSTIGIINALRTEYDSRYYYAKTYYHVAALWLALSKIHFEIVMALFRLKKSIRGNR